jgi:hypothetical protein
MENTIENGYIKTIKNMAKWFFSILFLAAFATCLLLQLEEPCEILFIIVGFIMEIIFFPMLLNVLIIESINEKTKKRFFVALGANLFFTLNSYFFIISEKYNNSIIFQISKVVVLIIVAIRICKSIKINTNNDFSYLKSVNLIMVAIISFIISLLKLNKIPIITNLENWLNFYYLSPFFLIQGIYEILDRRTKEHVTTTYTKIL